VTVPVGGTLPLPVSVRVRVSDALDGRKGLESVKAAVGACFVIVRLRAEDTPDV
jgi:hypothetical protein